MRKKIVFRILSWSLIAILTGIGIFYLSFDSYDAVTFTVKGEAAFMNGVIDDTTPVRVKELITNHKNLKTIIMVDVPGSANDEANLEASLMIRNAGLRTHIPSNGVIASGGVDFYLAGSVRTMEKGARFGVHSWGDDDENGNPIIAAEIPITHSMHKLYLSYYQKIGIDEEFYWYTLKAAPAESIHWMTDAEIKKYQVITGESGEKQN